MTRQVEISFQDLRAVPFFSWLFHEFSQLCVSWLAKVSHLVRITQNNQERSINLQISISRHTKPIFFPSWSPLTGYAVVTWPKADFVLVLLIWELVSRVSAWLSHQIVEGRPLLRSEKLTWTLQQAKGHPHFTGATYSLHRTKRRPSSSALCSPQQRARCPCLRRKSDSCGRSRSLHRLTFHRSGRAGSLPWPAVGSGSPGPASQPPRPSTRPGIVLLALRRSLAPNGWMLQPQQQGLFLENLVLGCTGWPASKTTLNRRHLCFFRGENKKHYQ